MDHLTGLGERQVARRALQKMATEKRLQTWVLVPMHPTPVPLAGLRCTALGRDGPGHLVIPNETALSKIQVPT